MSNAPLPAVEDGQQVEAASSTKPQSIVGKGSATLGLGIGLQNANALHNEPTPETPVEVKQRRREAKPKRSILKKPQPSQSRFSFKRDILQPINSRFVYPEGQASPQAEQPAAFSWRSALGRWTGPEGTARSPSSPAKETLPSPIASSPVASTSAPASTLLSVAPLKRVAFNMSTLAVVYPINATGQLPPADEAETRQRVEREFRKIILDRKRMPSLIKGKAPESGDGGWTGAELERLYEECCRTREVFGLSAVRAALQESLASPPRALNLGHSNLTLDSALALSDLLSVDWGLRKLVLEDANLDDDSLKPIVHALLVSASLPTLSLASNRRIRAKGWRMIAVLISKASRLAFLDLSDNNLDKRTVEWLLQALTANHSPPQLNGSPAVNLIERMPSPAIEQDGARSPFFDERLEAFMPKAPLLKSDAVQSRKGCLASLKLDNCGLKNQALEALAQGIRISGIKHISLRRNKVSSLGAVALAVMMRDYSVASDAPLPASATSSVESSPMPISVSTFEPAADGYNSVTASKKPGFLRTNSNSTIRAQSPVNEDLEEDASFGAERRTLLGDGWKPDDVRTRLQKQINALPRIGTLLTLDIKGNDIKGGVVYIAQVLKRNRTLRVLNLGDNKIEPPGLAAIAEALRHNATLETLDMSKNPCSGPSLDGILALRAAFSHNLTLMRVFLNSTELSSDGAIALAEFLPDAAGLIHLDLTENFDVDIAGVMALSAAVKLNTSIRCLDLNIPPNDTDFARLSQEILQSCIRNTETAQEDALAKGNKAVISAPIHTSAVARNLEESKANGKGGRPRSSSTVGTLLNAAQSTRDLLHELVNAAEERQRTGQAIGSEALLDVANEARVVRAQVTEALPAIKPTDRRDRLLIIRDELSILLDRAQQLSEAGPNGVTSRPHTPMRPTLATDGLLSPTSPAQSPLPEASSPSFSITDSDDESESGSEASIAAASALPRPQMHISVPANLPGDATAWSDFAERQSPRSPVDQHSRTLTLEEGEVFRRKNLLARHDAQADSSGSEEGDETHERDMSGEELRKEILEAEVPETERPSPRALPLSPTLSPNNASDGHRVDDLQQLDDNARTL